MPSRDKEPEAPTKTFADNVRLLERGTLVEDLADNLREMNAELSQISSDHGGAKVKGKLVLTLEVIIEGGQVSCVPEISVKMPKVKRPPTALWLTEKNDFSRSDPRQMEMGTVRAIQGDEKGNG
jgi:hypothetical protein